MEFLQSVGDFLVANEMVAVLLCVAFGSIVGKIHFGKVSLGATIGTLLVGLLLGQLGAFKTSTPMQMMFCYLCIFIVGYETGPAFAKSFKSTGAKVITLALFFVIVGAGLSILTGFVFNLGPAVAAGTLSGALTQSTGLIAAQEAMYHIGVAEDVAEVMRGDAAVAYAIGYMISLTLVVIFIQTVEGKLLGVDLKEDALKIAKERGHVEEAQSDGTIIEKFRGMDIFPWAFSAAIAIIIGGFSFTVGNITLSISGVIGILFAGIICGAINGKHPDRCRISSGARWFMINIGFNVFIACLSLNSAKNFVTAVQTMGIRIIIAVCIVAFGTYFISTLFGRFILKLNSVDIIGTQLGAGTYVVGFNGMVEYTGSTVYGTAYAPAYVVGNTLLTVFAPVIVYIMTAIMN